MYLPTHILFIKRLHFVINSKFSRKVSYSFQIVPMFRSMAYR